MIEQFSLPLRDPLETASGSIDRREGFLVRFEHHERQGIGEATPLPDWTESHGACERALERALAADGDGYRQPLQELDAGAVPAARHGFATALLDADARAEGTPLYRWLGGDRRDSVPVNATVGDGDVSETVDRSLAAVDRGFDCLKVKVGARSIDADAERIAAVRESVGDDVTLRADANGTWTRSEAERAFEALAEHGLSYVEQPLAPEDLTGHADLPETIDVALDEALVEHAFAEVLDSGVADYLVLKPMALGGPGTAHTLARRARGAGVEPVVSTTVDAVIARTAAIHVAAALPAVEHCGLATAAFLDRDIAPDPAPVSDGRIAVPQASGIGIDPEEVEP